MKVVILAAGLGERLRPVTNTIPKVMVTINSKPFLEYSIKSLKSAGLKDLIVIVGYKREQIMKYFGDGKKYGVNIEYIDQGQPLGTGNAILIAREKLSGDFAVCYGDSIIPSDDIKKTVRKFNGGNLDSIIGVGKYSKEALTSLGNVIIKDDKVVDIIEKPPVDKVVGNAGFAGFGIFKQILFGYLENLPRRFAGQDGLPDAIRLMANDRKNVGVMFTNRIHLTRKEDIETISREVQRL